MEPLKVELERKFDDLVKIRHSGGNRGREYYPEPFILEKAF